MYITLYFCRILIDLIMYDFIIIILSIFLYCIFKQKLLMKLTLVYTWFLFSTYINSCQANITIKNSNFITGKHLYF